MSTIYTKKSNSTPQRYTINIGIAKYTEFSTTDNGKVPSHKINLTHTSVKTSASSACTFVRRDVLATSISVSLSISLFTLIRSKTWRAFSFAASNPSVIILGWRPYNRQRANPPPTRLSWDAHIQFRRLFFLSGYSSNASRSYNVLTFWIHSKDKVPFNVEEKDRHCCSTESKPRELASTLGCSLCKPPDTLESQGWTTPALSQLTWTRSTSLMETVSQIPCSS